MNATICRSVVCRTVLLAVAFGCLDAQLAAAAETSERSSLHERIARGRVLFDRDWRNQTRLADADTKKLKGDGLGPMYNDVSCANCHHQGGKGGGGKADKNVQLLHAVRPHVRNRAPGRSRFLKTAGRIHPGFAQGTASLILHRFGKGDDGKLVGYDEFRSTLLGLPGRKPLSRANPFRKNGGVWLQLTERNTTALFGAGLIDKIPDTLLIQTAELQTERDPKITGRVPQTGSGAVGRFGWRGQTATLHDFVLGACAAELGLQVPGHNQAEDVIQEIKRNGFLVASLKTQRPLDLTGKQCRELTAFVASLPAPAPLKQPHLQRSLDIRQGQKLFEVVGCAACHVRDMGPAREIYSDLLLHDMGPDLADPLAATPELTIETSPSISFGYYGSSGLDQLVKVTTNIRQEWRTPPLWGVRDSAPYLHDGRAGSLEEAIRLHGGEARRSRARYAKLKADQRQLLLSFMNSLAPPGAKPGPVGGGSGSGFFSTSDQTR